MHAQANAAVARLHTATDHAGDAQLMTPRSSTRSMQSSYVVQAPGCTDKHNTEPAQIHELPHNHRQQTTRCPHDNETLLGT